MAGINEEYTKRPKQPVQVVKYTKEPQYLRHQYYEDTLAILVCRIKIWKAETPKWFNIPASDQCLTIRECESIEISESAKELISKAVIKFPRGTVISQSSKKKAEVTTGNKADSTENKTDLSTATNDGEVIQPQVAQDTEGVPTTSMAINYDDKGLIDFNRSAGEAALLSPNDVAIGNRIEIRLGYAYSDTEFKKMNEGEEKDSNDKLDLCFTGFITAVSVNTPLEIECMNMAHVLGCVSTPNVVLKHTFNIKDFLDTGGKYDLLKDTGIELMEHCKASEITVSGSSLSENLNIVDVLDRWSESGVLCMMENDQKTGESKLKVGLTYYAGDGAKGGELPRNDKKYITYNNGVDTVALIQFDFDVAEDKLSSKRVDKKYLAVEAIGRVEDKFIKLTIRKAPDKDSAGWTSDDAEDAGNGFQVVNQRESENRKRAKFKDGALSTRRIEGHLKNPVDLKKYLVVPYQSIKPNITDKELIEEAKQFWAKYNPNGLSGSITIFGDLFVKPTDIVGLVDIRQPEKQGYYYVESVDTYFGVNGYRRELKMPFKVASFAKQVTIIN